MLDCDKLPVDCCYENELNPDVLCISSVKKVGEERHRFMSGMLLKIYKHIMILLLYSLRNVY